MNEEDIKKLIEGEILSNLQIAIVDKSDPWSRSTTYTIELMYKGKTFDKDGDIEVNY